MGWQRGYYYRVRKVGGRAVREYVGPGAAGEGHCQLEGKPADPDSRFFVVLTAARPVD